MAIIIIVSLIIIEASIHWYIIEKKKKDPKQNSVFTFMRTFIYVILAGTLPGVTYSITFVWVLASLGWGLAILILRWAIFDYALNLMRPGKKLWHLGDITIDDKFEAKIDWRVLLVLKTLAVIATILIITIL
jgi:hypothetical protein